MTRLKINVEYEKQVLKVLETSDGTEGSACLDSLPQEAALSNDYQGH